MKTYLQTAGFLLLLCISHVCSGAEVLFSSLPPSLVVTASPTPNQVLKAGEDSITVTVGLNRSRLSVETDEFYENIKVKLCYAPVSQVDRKWRKTADNLAKDKTCQITIGNKPYEGSNYNQSFAWNIERDVPTATYFVRAYVYNSAGEEIAYGQTTDKKKSNNLFEIQGISGRHISLDIASICFSAFALLSLFGFFLIERSNNKRSRKELVASN